MFLTNFINVDNIAVLRQNFKHICMLLFFLFFQENYPYVVKVNNFVDIHYLAPWIRPI